MASRPVVSVYGLDGSSVGETTLPAVLTAPVRPDLVQFVHTQMNKNKRQAYSVNVDAGMQHSAQSWGTGRAVSRIPRVGGGGTQRSGQAAFGNMCRKGRMFAPTKIWRKWHKKINTNQKRYAVASALAASAIPALVMARGHVVDDVPEVPLVLDSSFESLKKTSKAVSVLDAVGVTAELEKVKASKKLRTGKGKMRNRRYVMKTGPLVIYANGDGVEKAVRNLPGVDTCVVDSLNLLQLAPGGHMGRFCIWSQAALDKLDTIYGTYTEKSAVKVDYTLPRAPMTNADLTRIINSDEIQSIVKPAITFQAKVPRKKNPLKNVQEMIKLNPYVKAARRAEFKRTAHKTDKSAKKALKSAGRAFYATTSKEGDVTF
jgi:large subunit ribosomal protein L4e